MRTVFQVFFEQRRGMSMYCTYTIKDTPEMSRHWLFASSSVLAPGFQVGLNGSSFFFFLGTDPEHL